MINKKLSICFFDRKHRNPRKETRQISGPSLLYILFFFFCHCRHACLLFKRIVKVFNYEVQVRVRAFVRACHPSLTKARKTTYLAWMLSVHRLSFLVYHTSVSLHQHLFLHFIACFISHNS